MVEELQFDSERDTLYHEAAHAVVAHLSGSQVARVSRNENHMELRDLVSSDESLEDRRLRLISKLFGLMSGYIAGTISEHGFQAEIGVASHAMADVVKSHLDDPGALMPQEDIIRSGVIASELVGPDRTVIEQLIDDSAWQTEELVRQLWEPIEATALKLAERGELTGDEFRETIRPWAERGELGEYPYPFTDEQFERLAQHLGA